MKWPSMEDIRIPSKVACDNYQDGARKNVQQLVEEQRKRVPNIPFGLGMFVFEVWRECRTIDVNKEV